MTQWIGGDTDTGMNLVMCRAAKWIWSIYAGITALLVGLLMLGGMD